MKLAALVILLILVFGCIGGGNGGTTTQPSTNQSNQSNQTGISIITGGQKNQTTEQNITKPPPEPENQTPPKELEYEYTPNETLGVYFIDVGAPGLHGNAVLIKKGDVDILVDAGPAGNSAKVVDFLHSKSVDDIEILISTSADPRNYGGMNAVADSFTIEQFWWTGDSFGDKNYSAVASRMANATKRVNVIEEGYSQEINGITFDALNPPKTQRFNDINNDAAVFRVTDRNFSMLLTSNIQTGAQGKLISEEKDGIRAQVMQAPYYGVGAGTSSIGIFLVTAKPSDMIITGSADETAVNGGSRDPLRRTLKQDGINFYETYKNGTIRVTSDGSSYNVRPA